MAQAIETEISFTAIFGLCTGRTATTRVVGQKVNLLALACAAIAKLLNALHTSNVQDLHFEKLLDIGHVRKLLDHFFLGCLQPFLIASRHDDCAILHLRQVMDNAVSCATVRPSHNGDLAGEIGNVFEVAHCGCG